MDLFTLGLVRSNPPSDFYFGNVVLLNFLGVIILFVYFSPLLFIFDCKILVISC